MQHHAFIESLDHQNYLPAIQAGLKFIGFEQLVSSNSRIFIKPNLTYPQFLPGVMTNPAAIEAAIIAISAYTSHIFIGDSDSGGYNRFSMSRVYEETGIVNLAKKYNVQLVNLSQLPRKTIQFDYKNKSFRLDLPVLLLEDVDMLVSMPVPKVHANTKVSLTFKNQWGCIPENKDRLKLHPYFRHVILEVNKAIKSKVAIIDGLFGLNQNGPMLGRPVNLNWLMVTSDLGTGARLCCDLMGIPISSIAHLEYARELGWIPKTGDIQINKEITLFRHEKFYLRRKLTDFPGLLAFNSVEIAYLAYFSPIADFLHRVLYLIRKPLYDYEKYSARK